MNISKLQIGGIYKYKDLCELLGVNTIEGSVKKNRQLEDFERYFSFERINNLKFKILQIYNTPFPGLDNGFFYKTVTIPVKCSQSDYEYLEQCNKWSAECWNMLIDADNNMYKKENRFMTRGELQTFVKDKTPLHSAGNQHVYCKYYTARDATFRSRKANHENSNHVELPYKQKEFYNTVWSLW